MTTFAGVMNTFKAVKEFAETMIELNTGAALKEKRFELQGLLLDAQNSVFAANEERTALVEKVRSLEHQVRDLKAWEADKDRYEMKDIGLGCIAYALKPGAQGSDPEHCLCANCFHDGKKKVLQPEKRSPRDTEVRVCHECGSELIVFGGRDWDRRPPEVVTRRKR